MPGKDSTALGWAPGRLARCLRGRELKGCVISSGSFGSARDRFERCQEHARCQKRSRLLPVYQDKAAISLHVGECVVAKDIKLPNVPEPRAAISAPLGTSVSHYPAPHG